jgi:outer membrane receptor protein involved in Fe transport
MWQRALRAPNINELFNGGAQGFPGFTDICAGTPGGNLLAFCKAQFTAAGAAFPASGSYTQVNPQSEEVTYGNPNLRPEVSNTFTVGAVITPSFLPNVTLSADFWRLAVKNFISPTAAAVIENQCFNDFVASGNNPATFGTFATLGQTTAPNRCSFVSRQQDGELIFNVPFSNQGGGLATSGIDLQATVTHDVADLLDQSGDWGALDLNVAAQFLTEFVNVTGSGSVSKYKGLIDPSSPAVFATPDARPNYKFTTRLGYTLGEWRGVVTWSEDGGLRDCFTRRGPNTNGCAAHATNVRPYDRVDLAIRWNFADKYSADLVVDNLFNTNPPLGPYSRIGGINTLAETYDVLGTQAFIGLTAKL